MTKHPERRGISQRPPSQRQQATREVVLWLDVRLTWDEFCALDGPALHRAATRLRRLTERERQRGLRRHHRYDLDRHIALKSLSDLAAARQGGRRGIPVVEGSSCFAGAPDGRTSIRQRV